MYVIKMKDSEKYPALDQEIKDKKTIHVPLKYVDEEQAKEIESDIEKESEKEKDDKKIVNPFRFAGYDPDIIDFIRRCDTTEQAEEIIAFMEKKGELTKVDAKKIREQLSKEGLRSFGEKKEKGYYFQTQ